MDSSSHGGLRWLENLHQVREYVSNDHFVDIHDGISIKMSTAKFVLKHFYKVNETFFENGTRLVFDVEITNHWR